MHLSLLFLVESTGISAADPNGPPGLGIESLSDQSLLERMIGLAEGIHNFINVFGHFKNIHDWVGLGFDTDGRVERLNWFQFFDGGQIDMHCLPRSVKYFSVSDNKLTGSIDTALLPRGLVQFACGTNFLTGAFCMRTLPPVIQQVGISSNRFEGTLDIAVMPEQMVEFRAGSNRFFGSLDVSRLPDTLIDLSLGCNEFTGMIDLSVIPPAMERMLLAHNMLEQEELVVGVMPDTLQRIDLRGSLIQRVVGVDGMPLESKRVVVTEGMRYS